MENHKWYVINTVIGRERTFAVSLQEDFIKHNLQDIISEIFVPTEKIVEVKRGKKVEVERKICPGYILVRMLLNDRAMSRMRAISGFAKVLGRDKKPTAIPDREVHAMIEHLEKINTSRSNELIFSPGEIIKINEGAFSGFSARIESVDSEKMRLKVSVSIFGRETPVELDFKQATRAHDE